MISPPRRPRRIGLAATACVGATLLAACSSTSSSTPAAGSSTSTSSSSSSSSSSAATSASSATSGSTSSAASGSASGAGSPVASISYSGTGDSTFTFLSQDTNTTISKTLGSLSKDQCATEQSAAPLKTENSPGNTYDQKIQLLVGQDALPNMEMAAGTPDLNKQFIKAGKLEDLSKIPGVTENVLPAAASTIKSLYNTDDLYALPTEFNIEGIWYNKKVFSDNNITPPKTWDELLNDVKTLKSAGTQPIAVDGKDGWDITRWIGDYIFRDLGPDALQQVADGKAKLTDPGYVKAAQAVADLGKMGAFGAAPGEVDYNGSLNEFLTGKAAMLYMGSWALGNFNDPKQNAIGADNIGYMPFPAVTGGKGTIDQVPSNVGVPVVFATKGFGSNIGNWVTCIAKNYGDQVLKDSGVVSGFRLTNPPVDLPPLTKTTEDVIANAKSSVLWFEALFNAKATTISQNSAAALASGGMSAQDFMQKVQSANSGS